MHRVMPLRRMPSSPYLFIAAATLFLAVFAGCKKKEPVVQAQPKPKAPPQVSEIDLKTYKPNEAGAVMIVMYHRFEPNLPSSDKYYNRRPEDFRKDLEALYKRGYRPVTVSEFVENRMDVPAGKTPIVLTFDDAWESQFRVITGKDGQPHIDPDCAVGIMETFHKAHPDWATKGTFFVLPKEGRNGDPFGQPEFIAEKFRYLIEKGYEIGNHSSTHSLMRRMSAKQIQWEIATAVRDIKQINPQAQMQTLAIPYGALPRKDLLKYLKSGESGGTRYQKKAILLAAWRPVLSPVTRADKRGTQGGVLCVFDPYRLERVKPDPNPKAGTTFEYWLKFFDANPSLRYVSDGNPQVVSVPKALKSMVDESRVRAQGKVLQAYSLTTSPGSPGEGPALSVETVR